MAPLAQSKTRIRAIAPSLPRAHQPRPRRSARSASRKTARLRRTRISRSCLPGQYLDEESGLSQNWWRTYDSTLGRYLQEETLVRGIDGMAREYLPSGNLPYTYAAGNPQRFFDPDGEGIVDCAEALARLAYLQAKLAQRVAENCHCPDPGHDKAIKQLQNAVAKQAAKVAKHCTDPSTLFQALLIAAAAATFGPAAAPACAL